jgi:hypothetical protein
MRLPDRRSALRDRFVLLTVALCLAASSPARCAEVAFAQNFLTGSKQVVTYPVGNPTSVTVVGPLTDTLIGMDFDPAASELWAINFATHALGTINPATGAFAQSVVLADTGITAFTIDPVAGTFYVSKGDQFIYGLDPVSGETTLLAAGAPAGLAIRALAADCAGAVFAFASNGVDPDALYRSQPGVSDSTLIGTPGYAGATSVEFDNRSGALYAWFNTSGNTTSTHVLLNTTTGAASQASVVDGRYRMAIRNECSIFMDDFEV